MLGGMRDERPEASPPLAFVRVREVVRVSAAPGVHRRVASAGEPSLVVALRGRVRVQDDAIVVAELEPRDVLFASPEGALRVHAAHREALVVAARLDGAVPGAPARVHLRSGDLAGRPALGALLDALEAELALRAPDARALAALLEATSTHLSRASAPAVDPQVARVVEAVRKDPGRPWTLEALAKVAGLSRAALVRRLRRALGAAPLEFVHEQRMRRAAERLSLTEDGLAEIAVLVGYASEFAFAKAFKRRFGIAPGLFRRRQRAELRGLRPTMLRAA